MSISSGHTTYKHLIEESLVLKAAPVGLIKVSRTVEDGSVAGVEHDIDLVAVLRFRGHYVMDDFHLSLNVAVQS